MSVGNNIKRKREAKGISQLELAEQIGCSRSLIAQFEVDIKMPSLAMGKAMADIFGCTVDELVNSNAV